jgi:hypothetical protein
MADTAVKIPLVYEHSTDDQSTLGLGHVEHVISCQVESVYDQFPQMTLICEYTQSNADRLLKDRILLADVGDGWHKQLFRINSVESDWSDNQREMTIIATHVASDLSGNVLTADVSTANASPSQVWDMVTSNLSEPTDVTVNSSITDVAIVNWDATQVDQLSSILFGRDNNSPSFTSLYDAEWWFDNYTWTFEHHVGRDTGIVIKYGKHLKSLQNTDTISGVYTAVRPISKYTPGQTGTGDDSNVIALDGTAMIQYAGTGGLPVFDTPFKGQVATGKTLTNGSRFKIYSYAESGTVNDHTWYNLGGKQWVDGNYLSFDKGQTGQFPSVVGNKATGKGTIAAGLADNPGVISKYDGVITVNYVGPGKVAIWDSPWVGRHVTGSYMANGSAWNAYGKATDESGQTWYNLGGNQWVSAQYVALDKAKDYAYQKVRGIGTAKVDKGKIALWNRPSFNGSITRMISSGTRWQIYGEASGGGSSTWYDLGGSQWIDGQYMDFSAANNVEPKPVGGDSSSSDTSSDTSDTVWSYNSPGTWNTRVKQYTTGNQVTIYGQGTAGGATWYNIGTNEWLEADYLTFGNNTDVEPSGSADNMNADATQVTLTLPEKYIAVPMPDGQQYEHQRIVNFDASSYGITTVDDLRSITQAYIRDNNIGKPQITLTIDYDELQGHYQNLASVRCYDVVTVFLPEINLNIKAEVTDVIYDTLLQQNTQVTIGNRPLTTTDDLAAWVKKAEEKANAAAQKNSDAVDDMDLAWKKAVDDTNAAFKAGDARTAEQQTEWEKQFKETIDQDINSFKDYVGGQVQSANELASIVHYNNNDVTFYNGSGTQVGSLGAGGLVYYNGSGNPTTVVSSDGKIIASEIAGNELTGTVIHGAEIDSGTVTALDYFSAKSNAGLTVISGDWGLSADSGINVAKNGSFSHFGGAINMDGALTSQSSGYFKAGISLGAGGSSYISFSNGCYLYANSSGTIAIHDQNGSHTL